MLVGIMPHTTQAEVDQLISGLQKLIHGGGRPVSGARTAARSPDEPLSGVG